MIPRSGLCDTCRRYTPSLEELLKASRHPGLESLSLFISSLSQAVAEALSVQSANTANAPLTSPPNNPNKPSSPNNPTGNKSNNPDESSNPSNLNNPNNPAKPVPSRHPTGSGTHLITLITLMTYISTSYLRIYNMYVWM